MPKLNGRVPAYRLHKHSGQAIVTLSGIDHYLGPHGSQVSKDQYDRLIAEWLARGRHAAPSAAPEAPEISINQIVSDFWDHAQVYYRHPDGTPTSEVESFRQVLRPLRQLYGRTSALSFGPTALRAVREQLVALGRARRNINRQIGRLRYVFKWAASQEKLPASIYQQLQSVPPLKRGRTSARETPRVRPAPEDQIQAIRPFVSRPVWALVRLQLLTGARPGELVGLRGVDLHTQEAIWTARPEEHKTSYRELPKTIYFGPQAQTILKEFLQDRPLDACLFSAVEAEQQRQVRRHAARRTPPSCGNGPGTHRAARPARGPADRYSVESYRRAITRACDLAFPPPEALARRHVAGRKGQRWETDAEWKTRLGPEAWSELQAWQKAHRWHPHQLRHNAGTVIRREFGLEMARVVLGHSSVAVTEIYAEQDEAKAHQVIKKIG